MLVVLLISQGFQAIFLARQVPVPKAGT